MIYIMLREGTPPEDIRRILDRMKEVGKSYDGNRNPWGFGGPF